MKGEMTLSNYAKGILFKLDDTISIVALVAVNLLTFLNVIFRYFFGKPFTWETEIVLALFTWMIFVGISSNLKNNEHVGIDYFMRRMPSPLKKFFTVVRNLVIYGVIIYVLIFLGVQIVISSITKTTSVLHISYSYIYI